VFIFYFSFSRKSSDYVIKNNKPQKKPFEENIDLVGCSWYVYCWQNSRTSRWTFFFLHISQRLHRKTCGTCRKKLRCKLSWHMFSRDPCN